ncbi:GINS complex subunit 2 [Pancytospora philotis]|nr:GINS complex subunit 2 [Pancytospora philotis]KAI4291094.1 GINS complex subunit 2 [Pancytospora philotis]
MSPEELINLALQYEVEVEAHSVVPAASFYSVAFRGLHPLTTASLPLYMALHLRSAGLCSIKTPQYLTKDFLEQLVERERTSQAFVDVPEFLFEHAHVFMHNDIEPAIAELKQLRLEKIWQGLKDIDGKALYINGLTKWEFNEMRTVIVSAMELGKRVEQCKE